MSFLEDVRAFLRHPAAMSVGDMGLYRRQFVRLMQRREEKGADRAQLWWARQRLGHKLEGYVRVLEQRLLAAGVRPGDIPGLVIAAMARELDIEEQPASAVHAVILEEAAAGLLDEVPAVHEPWRNIAVYVQEIHALRVRAGRAEVTELGRVLLELAGIEAIKWLLHIEVALATGPGDPWRVARSTLRDLVETPHLVLPESGWDTYPWLVNWNSIHRLAALELLAFPDEEQAVIAKGRPEPLMGYQVEEHALPILREVGEGADTPMAVLVAALLDDDIRSRLPAGSAASSTQATVRQARHVIHEISNALVPVKSALQRIYRVTRRAGVDEQIADYRRRMTVEGKRVCIIIDDNGPGVAPEVRDKIFMDGYSTRPDGTGFGLAAARATIEGIMSGTLTCEDGSALGGARFVITLPRHNGSAT